MKIEVINPISSMIRTQDARLIKPAISYDYRYSVETPHRRVLRTARGEMTLAVRGDRSRRLVYTGLIPRISSYLKSKNIQLEILYQERVPRLPVVPPTLDGVVLRADQKALLRKCLYHQRGVVKAPTGWGKTVLAMAILSSFLTNPNRTGRALFLVHELTLARQTMEEFSKHFDVGMLGGGENDVCRQVTIATRQSVMKDAGLEKGYDVVIVDECHHVSKRSGEYARALRTCLAPVRFGISATPPTESDRYGQLVTESLIGPLIGEFTLEEGIDLGLLAKPRLHLIELPFDQNVRDTRTYANVYRAGVVENVALNTRVVEIAKEFRDKKLTTLVFVTQVDHGRIIERMALQRGINAKFVYGSVESHVRNDVRHMLESGEIECVIANVVWKEGINVPSLGAIINAAGGKKERVTIQSLGRGLRTTDEKKEIVFVDFFNPSHHYLIDHFGSRITLYFREGWI